MRSWIINPCKSTDQLKEMTKTAEATGDGNKTNDLYATLKAEEHQRIY